jgi:hypothetical protein
MDSGVPRGGDQADVKLEISMRRPCERRDPYAVPPRFSAVAETFYNN